MRAYVRRQSDKVETEIKELNSLIAGLYKHNRAICDFLMYRAEHSDILDEKWVWKEGEDIPKILKETSALRIAPLPLGELIIPNEFLCPVSTEIMVDPVITCDGFTFERNNIER